MLGIQAHLGVSSIVLYVTFALTAYTVYLWLFRKTKNLPPGPRGLRSLIDIIKATRNETLHELALDWADKYGPLTFVNILGQPTVLMNTVEVSRRILGSDKTKHAVANRTPNAAAKMAWYNGKDLVFTPYDALSKKKRRMFHNVIGLFGDGVEKFENVVSKEMERLYLELEQLEDQDIDLSKHISRSLKIVIYILVVGECPDDVTKPDILEAYDIAFNKLWAADLDFVITNIPILAKVPGRYKNAVDRLYATKVVAEELMYFSPKKTWTPGQPRGIADLLFDLQAKPGNEWMQKDPEHVIAFVTSLFLAAHLTSRATLNGGFLCLLNNPEVVKKMHEEIDNVLGDRKPKVEDRSIMPYTEATILEILRLITQAPLSGIRTASEDIDIDGVTIPKDTLVLMNSWYFHHDKRVFDDPWAFKPERFLDSSGQMLPADSPMRKNILPFGFGARSCPGEVFARSRAFMYFTGLLQKYDLLPPENEKLVPADFRSNHEDVKGFIRQTLPFKCRLRQRQKPRF